MSIKTGRNAKIGSHGVDRTHKVKHEQLLTSDIAYWRDKLNIDDGIYIVTDVWTLKGQVRIGVKAWVVEKYTNFFIVEFYWNNARGPITLNRCIQYKDLAIADRTGEKITVDMHNKTIDKEVTF